MKLEFGESVTVTGSAPELGAWGTYIPLTWTEGHVWQIDVELPKEYVKSSSNLMIVMPGSAL